MKFSLAITAVLCVALFLFISGCDKKPTAGLELIHSDEVYVVPGSASNCTDIRSGTSPIPTSLTTDFFKLNNFVMRWSGSNYLVPAAIIFKFNSPYIDGSPVTCTISGTGLADTFGANSVFAPAANGALYRDISMNDPSYGPACAIGCGGIKRVDGHANQSFSTTATVEFIGYSQDLDGSNTKAVRTTSHLRLNFF